MDCNGCEKKGDNAVSFIVHSADMSRLERTIKRLWILLIIMLVMLVGTNIGWIMYESQFETVTSSTTEDVSQYVDANGTAIVAGIGDAIYGNEGQTND